MMQFVYRWMMDASVSKACERSHSVGALRKSSGTDVLVTCSLLSLIQNTEATVYTTVRYVRIKDQY